MIIVESCKGCGSNETDVTVKDGVRFLICSYCKSTLAILEKEIPPKVNDFFTIRGSGQMVIDFIASGIMYSGIPNYNQILYT